MFVSAERELCGPIVAELKWLLLTELTSLSWQQLSAGMFYIFFLSLSSDGTLLLGASSLSGRSWQGSVWIYSEPEKAPNEELCKAGVQTEAGVVDVKWVSEKGVVVASDSGKKRFHSGSGSSADLGNVKLTVL